MLLIYDSISLEQSTFCTLDETDITLLKYWADGSLIVIRLPLESIALVDQSLGQCLFVPGSQGLPALGISFSYIFGREFRRCCGSSSD